LLAKGVGVNVVCRVTGYDEHFGAVIFKE
jgi:hypothetical protein